MIPLDEKEEGGNWSRAFYLGQADLEPWTSFYEGYKKSILFAQTTPTHAAVWNPDDEAQVNLQLQYEVQAILSLRKLDPKIIFAPVVQISRTAEYFDLISEISIGDDPQYLQSLDRISKEIHEKRLIQAVEQGRQMGERLYHNLLGENYINLSKEWENIHQRAPNVNEMHSMFSTGNILTKPQRTIPLAKSSPPIKYPRPAEPVLPMATRYPSASILRHPHEKLKPAQAAKTVLPPPAAIVNAEPEVAPKTSVQEKVRGPHRGKIFLHLIPLSIVISLLATYALLT
ncbi:MAG: hypothetical protein Q7R66_00815 [Undibacterium sp.]|uniref:hypothetical protein n=1 Tax=Undibacterium sp. TaxID=1914977 RepID=UPI00271B6386|nr:hypothetical protein [Undibacterium sp.]MDO8650718.1 hypothetical protein [Undibacterium sp.]